MAGILQRLAQPGIVVLVIGAALCYGAKRWSALLPLAEDARPKAQTAFRFAGLALAFLGAVMVFLR